MTISIEQAQQLFLQGSSLLQNGYAGRALDCFQQAQRIESSNPTLLLYSGAALHDLKRFDEAVVCYEKALQIAPLKGEIHNNLGNALIELGRFSDAALSFSEAIPLLPSSPVPLTARATALQAMGYIAEAEADCRTALTLDPSFASAHWNLALNLLLQGNYSEGWEEYEWRWQKPDFTSPRRHTDIPLWDGSPLDGQTILLHAEQGFGDAIQFIRYVPLVVSCGGNVVLECHPQLVSLFQSIKEVTTVVSFDEQVPACSCQAALLTLPRIFGTTLNNIPDCLYLSAPAEQRARWHQHMSYYMGTKVGIVWAGSSIHRNDSFRSLPSGFLLGFAQRTDITLFSLQLGDAKRQLQSSSLAERVIDLTDQIHDFADTAALIEQLDLVLTVDTAVAHLAGTLGKAVHLMLPFAPDWRWLLGRSDSPWYPTMQIFRQERPEDWGGVIERIQAVLDTLSTYNKNPSGLT